MAIVIVLNYLTEPVTTTHIFVVGGFCFLGLLGVMFGKLLSYSGGAGGTKSLSGLNKSNIKSQADAVERVNELLEDRTQWDQIVIDPKWVKAKRKRIINKKDRETEIYWSVFSRLKNDKLPVLIIYNESYDVIEDYDPDPAPGKRVDAFEGFDPLEVGRMMSRGRDEEKDEEEEERPGIDFNINANDKEKEEGKGWFS